MATSSIVLASGALTFKKITGHKGDVNWCAFSPVKPQLVTASGDKTVRVWDVAGDTPTEIKVLKGHKYYVNCAVFSPLGDLLATGSSDFSAKLWSTETFTEIATLQTQGNVKCCSFTLDGAILATASADNLVYVWEVSSLRLLKKLKKHDQSVLTCAFAPCGWMLASGDSGGEVIIWDIHAGTALYYKTIHDMGINCLLFLTTRDPGQGQHTMISAGSDCVITIWTVSSNATGVHGSYRVTVVKERSLTGHTGSVCNCSLSQDNKLLASVSNDKTVIIWSLETFAILKVFSAHDRFITCCCFSVDNKLLATTSTDYSAKIWHLSEENNSSLSLRLAPSAPPMESSMTGVVNPPLWESQVLQWLSDVVARERQKEKTNTSQHQYDISLVAKMTSLCNQLSTVQQDFRPTNMADPAYSTITLRTGPVAQTQKANPEVTDPQDFCCPITQARMVDPVVAADGYTYERSAIVSWLSEGRSTSPMTNLPFPHTNLVPNKTLKQHMDSQRSR